MACIVVHLIYHQNIKLASMALKFHLNIIKTIFVSTFNKNLAMTIEEERSPVAATWKSHFSAICKVLTSVSLMFLEWLVLLAV